MIANYHSHTTRCHHAKGTEVEFITKALERGLKIFGFSDHTPQYFPGNYYSFMRMYPHELEDYCNTVRQLQRDYADQIQIPLGVEAEYYPATWKELLPRLRDAGIEYLILGQHWLGNEENEPYVGDATTDEAILKQYCHQAMDGLNTGAFTYIAHPDVINFVGDRNVYRRHMRDLIRCAHQANVPLEMNLLGLRSNRHYPDMDFWAIAAEEGCEVILGMDAHEPGHIQEMKTEKQAMEIVRHFGLKLLDTVEFKVL